MSDDGGVRANPFVMPGKVYDFLKQVALVLLPAVSTLYFMLGETWGWSNVAQVVGTIAAIDTFLGAILGLSARAYNRSDAKYDGTINHSFNEKGKKTYLLEINSQPEVIDVKKSIILKVQGDS